MADVEEHDLEEEEGEEELEERPRRFTITHGDITLLQLREGAMVNPSNTGLILGSGVSESIARRAGPQFQQKLHMARSSLYKNKLDLGQAMDTEAGQLPCKRLIHVSIIGKKKVDKRLITTAILNVYDLAEEIGIDEIAFPALGVGVGKFPIEDFVELFFTITMEELPRSESIEHVVLCLFDEHEFDIARAYYEEHKDEIPEIVTVDIVENTMWGGI